MSADIDCIVAGAGVVGLAIARRLALAGLEVAVLEQESHVGAHSSSRNSEVIHAGIYYPKDSLKARLCVAGKKALYEYCANYGIAHKRIGKIIVATDSAEERSLKPIELRARDNGVSDLVWLDSREIAKLEPEVRAVAGLLSPSTGIIDSHTYMQQLVSDIEAAGGSIVLRSEITRVDHEKEGFNVEVDGELAACSRMFVNSAGLWATDVARNVQCAATRPARPTRFARGHYFAYTSRSPFTHLIYPVPVEGGLGIHATNDLSGAVRFGPDVQWVEGIDYNFPDGLTSTFADAIRRYYPNLDAEKLHPDYAGIRPKLSGPGEPPADFAIEGPATHGVRGLVNLYGMESPALTASLAIADYVHDLLTAAAS